MILLLDAFIIILGCLAAAFFFLQVVIPMTQGTPLFPIFRKTKYAEEIRAAEHELETVNEEAHLRAIREQIELAKKVDTK